MSGAADAATVDMIKGNVQVNAGGGFQPVAGSTTVPAGASIMTAQGSSARILYSNNCFVDVAPGTVITVVPDDQCVPAGTTSSFGPTQVIIGGAILAGGVAAVLISNKDSDKPASP